jgi:hypothetical protein
VGGNLHFGAMVRYEMHLRVSFDLEISVAFGLHAQQLAWPSSTLNSPLADSSSAICLYSVASLDLFITKSFDKARA